SPRAGLVETADGHRVGAVQPPNGLDHEPLGPAGREVQHDLQDARPAASARTLRGSPHRPAAGPEYAGARGCSKAGNGSSDSAPHAPLEIRSSAATRAKVSQVRSFSDIAMNDPPTRKPVIEAISAVDPVR